MALSARCVAPSTSQHTPLPPFPPYCATTACHPRSRLRCHAAVENLALTYVTREEKPLQAAIPCVKEPEYLHQTTHGGQQGEQHVSNRMQEWIHEIKEMFASMSLGEISVSPYDTAWVAMVPSLDGSNGPQFPQCLNWIIRNQHSDGSWGDKDLFLAYDRVCSTVACLIALKTWNIGLENIQKGVDFIHKNIHRIEEEADDYMPTAFEVTFPSMMEDAKILHLDLPYSFPFVEKLSKARDQKLKRISMEVLHSHPSTLLHSLEGLHRLVDWQKLLKLQTADGSFLFSPASTACALKYTGDAKCLSYLNMVLDKYIDAVPSVYPVDLFEHLWMVDRLERLGISRFFEKEIKNCLDYAYKYWTPRGIGWARDSNIFDVDDTAMAFRLFRLHGYHVSPEVFQNFKKNKEFFCFEGQTSQAVTGMHNLYRASQIMLPNETILEEIKTFTRSFLIDKQQQNKIADKWVISNGLKREVSYSINQPWAQSLPRIEARDFIEHYGVDDAWIAKSLYRMKYVNNEVFLKLAKEDYNTCQLYHQKELAELLRWYKECQFDKLVFAHQKPTDCFFSIAATLFEPQYSCARIVWAMCSILATIIDDFYDVQGSLKDLERFSHAIECWDPNQTKDFSKEMQILFMGIFNTINKISQDAIIAQGQDISCHMRNFVMKVVNSMYLEAKWRYLKYCPTLEEYMINGKTSSAIGAIVQPTLFFLGEKISKEELKDENYLQILDAVSTIGLLRNDLQSFKRQTAKGKWSCISIFLRENPKAIEMEAIQNFKLLADEATKRLVEECLWSTNVQKKIKMAYLHMAKIFNLVYSKGDGYFVAAVVSSYVKNVLYVPIP